MATDAEKHYWLVGRHDVQRFECIEIIHPSFTRHYRFVRNNGYGLRAKHENGTYYNYDYVPITVKPGGSGNGLEQSLNLGIGDGGGIIPQELDRLRNGKHSSVRPTVNYRVYLSDNLKEPLQSVRGLEVVTNNPNKYGAVFACKAKEVNKSKTGVVRNFDKHYGLRGFT